MRPKWTEDTFGLYAPSLAILPTLVQLDRLSNLLLQLLFIRTCMRATLSGRVSAVCKRRLRECIRTRGWRRASRVTSAAGSVSHCDAGYAR
jgi:hypothetical protein